MALWILAPDSTKTCCTCADLPTVCSNCTPVVCSCALLMPLFGGVPPYTTYANAATDLAATISQCYYYSAVTPPSTNTFILTSTTLTYNSSLLGSIGGGLGSQLIVDVNLKAGNAAFAYNLHNGLPNPSPSDGLIISIQVDIFTCVGTFLDSIGASSNAHGVTDLIGTLNYTVPADGEYILSIVVSFAEGGGHINGDCTSSIVITPMTSISVNPPLALWDDSGNIRKLDACSRFLLPVFTEITNIWFADLASAQGYITSNTSNCVGCVYYPITGFLSFIATDGGSSLTLVGTTNNFDVPLTNMAGSVNALGGQTLSMAYSIDWTETGTARHIFIEFDVRDHDGHVIYSGSNNFFIGIGSGTQTGTIVSSALPYNGKYIVSVTPSIAQPPFLAGLVSSSVTAVITSSGTMSVNPIQALYDTGNSCPTRYNCV